MAELTRREQVETIRTLLDAYGVGVRAGVLTPCLQDENAFRAMIGLLDAPAEVVAQWDATNGIRLPVTLQRSLSSGDPAPDPQMEQQQEDMP